MSSLKSSNCAAFRSSALALIAVILLGPAACKPPTSQVQPEKVPPEPVRLSAYEPADSYKEIAPGLLGRTVYTAEGTGATQVEFWDLTVGPGKKSAMATLPGAAIVEVRSGQGSISVSGKAREIRMGQTFGINEGDQFTLENRGADTPLAMRATVIRRQPQPQ